MEDVQIEYRGYVIMHPTVRRDTSGWTVNLSSNSRHLIVRLDQPCMVITDGHSLEAGSPRRSDTLISCWAALPRI